MKVKLRNSDGQFCTLAEYCAEEPVVEIRRTKLSLAANDLPGMRDALVFMERIAEVAKAFGLETNRYSTGTWYASLAVSKDGVVCYSCPDNGSADEINRVLDTARKLIAEAEELAAKWQATEYEVED